MPPDTKYAKSVDVHIAYQVTGEGPVDLVLAPGTASHLDLDWEWPEKVSFLEQLGSFCRLIRFDKRGTGLSDRPTDAATPEERMDDIRAVMDAAGSDRAVVFGYSEGANLGALFASTFPQRTRALLVWALRPAGSGQMTTLGGQLRRKPTKRLPISPRMASPLST
jgi:pimeloyl-ACP methyl ester carboxylesterase